MAAQDILYQLQSLGLYEIILPFLLIFTIVFAILEKTKIFGTDNNKEPKTKINAVVSLILGLLIVNQFEIVNRLNLFLPKVSLFIVIAVMFLILLGIFGAQVSSGISGIFFGIAALISLLVIYWSLSPSIGLDFGSSPLESWFYTNSSTIIFLFIIGIIIWAVVSKPKSGSGKDGFFEGLRKVIDRDLKGSGGKD
jgi:cation transport ATPase